MRRVITYAAVAAATAIVMMCGLLPDVWLPGYFMALGFLAVALIAGGGTNG